MDTPEVQKTEISENRKGCGPSFQLEKGTYTEWQLFFLVRLERLLRLEEDYVRAGEATGVEGASNVKLLHKAIYSTYRDCIDLGVGDAARRMFKEMAGRA